jgi:L-lysine exporter family protein LysE/ArgO
MFSLSAALSGFLLGASLIIAIGAQNAFILRQGLLRSHVFILCLICALSDAVLITAGVAGLGTLVSQSPTLIAAVSLGGMLFLGTYAFMAFPSGAPSRRHAGGKPGAARPQGGSGDVPRLHLPQPACLSRHGCPARQPVMRRTKGRTDWPTGQGRQSRRSSGSFGLGYGARLLQPVFAKPAAWRVLDG